MTDDMIDAPLIEGDETAAAGEPVILDGPCKLVDGVYVPLTDEEIAEFEAGLSAPPVAPVPEEISDRQFVQQLAILGQITEAEALAWAARGDLPAGMSAAVDTLPAGDRFPARMLLSSATVYQRSHPMVSMLGAMLGYDDAALDDLWRAAAKL